MLTLALSKDIGKPFGWGICSLYLSRELSKKTKVRLLSPEQPGGRIDGKVLHSIADITFRSTYDITGDYNAGYCFFEMDLINESISNMRSFNHLFCGSTFNQKVLAYYNCFHTSVLIQGVDHKIFNAVPPRKEDGKFIIFSGGKFEYRKGQDLVLAAFRELMHKYKDMYLVTVWENLWSSSIETMRHSHHISLNGTGATWSEAMTLLCENNGIPADRVTHYPICPQEVISEIMENTDIGIFPNRCEGGTNLMLMEYMAKGRPVIASYNTGHKDILAEDGTNAILLRYNRLNSFKPFSNSNVNVHWNELNLDELISNLEWAYLHRDDLKKYGSKAAETMKQLTWESSANHILNVMMDPKIDEPDYLAQRYVFGDMLTRLGYKGEGAEIGVLRGNLSRFIYSRWFGKKLHLIDRWKETPGYKDICNQSQKVQDELYESVKKSFAKAEEVNIIRAESLEAAKQFKDGQLDWVYIDADHSYEAVKADIEAWFPKVRIGGLVSGDDYIDIISECGTFGVKSAVDEFIKQNDYKLKFSDDTDNPNPTWYFIKDH